VEFISSGAIDFPFPRDARCPLDPASGYAKLRAERPVCPVTTPAGDVAWLVTRYADVRQVTGAQ
jgi:hypothetical protein